MTEALLRVEQTLAIHRRYAVQRKADIEASFWQQLETSVGELRREYSQQAH